MPQLPQGTAQQRNRALIDHPRRRDAQWRRFVGTTARVLIEERSGGYWRGHGVAFEEVRIRVGENDSLLEGSIVQVKLENCEAGVFDGERVDRELYALNQNS